MSKEQPLVFSITPSFNAKQQTLHFIADMKRQSYKNLVVVIVDDGSSDGTAEAIAEQYPEVVVLSGTGSLWWSGSTNLGVEYACSKNADYILTVNNDLAIGRAYLQNLIDAAQKNPRALIGSTVVYESDPQKVWFAGAGFDYKCGEMQHVNGPLSQFKGKILPSDWLSGMGVLIPAEVFEKIGFYNAKDFPQYFGDSDFSLRAKLVGYRLLVSGSAVIRSDVESSWVHRQIKRPNARMFTDLLLSIRSPYQVKSRVAFYRLYWGKHWRSQLFKLYFWSMRGIYFRFSQAYIKKIIRR